ncbi:VTT domain-containing protein [Acidobacteria bacterium AH-259-D05]|nr:VTT domain-containing protein [Acidobacteria bacterium AH-259-D05]
MAAADGFLASLRIFLGHVYQFIAVMGGPGLFVIALADSSFLSLPEGNDVLIVVLSTGQNWRLMTYYVLMTTFGSVCGCSVLYTVGRRGGTFLEKRLKGEKVKEMKSLYHRWGIWAILIPSLLPPPTPFKIFVLSAGLFRISFTKFLFSVVVGRSLRYFMWGILAVLYGEVVKIFIDQNLPLVGMLLFLLLTAIIASYTIRWFRSKKKTSQHEIA